MPVLSEEQAGQHVLWEMPADQPVPITVAQLYRTDNPDVMEMAINAPSAMITRSRKYMVPVIVNTSGDPASVRVDGRGVVGLRVLRHRNRIEVRTVSGSKTLTFWEMTIGELDAAAPQLGRRCSMCALPFTFGQEMIICPRCQTPYHKECYLTNEYCPNPAGCKYPVRNTLRRALEPFGVTFEVLPANSKLVEEKRACAAGNRRDRAPFKPGAEVVYCPNPLCTYPDSQQRTAFHPECLAELQRCPHCQFEVSLLFRALFVPGAAEIRLEGGGMAPQIGEVRVEYIEGED